MTRDNQTKGWNQNRNKQKNAKNQWDKELAHWDWEKSVRLANSQANFRKEKIQMNKIKDNEGTFHQKVKKSREP